MRKAPMILMLLLTASASAVDFDISWYTLNGGGGYSSNATFELAGTIGQPDAAAMNGAGFAIQGGFWAGVPAPCAGDATGDGKVDLSDLALLLSQFGEVGGTFGGDLDNDGDVDLSDLALLLTRFGEIC